MQFFKLIVIAALAIATVNGQTTSTETAPTTEATTTASTTKDASATDATSTANTTETAATDYGSTSNTTDTNVSDIKTPTDSTKDSKTSGTSTDSAPPAVSDHESGSSDATQITMGAAAATVLAVSAYFLCDSPLAVMALALRFAEEGEFSSRACDISSLEAPDAEPSKAIFRWSRSVREVLESQAIDAVKVKMLVVAMPGAAQQFVQQLTSSWTVVGTLLTNDQIIQPCKLQSLPCAGVILSKMGTKVLEENNCLALLVGHQVPSAATWAWLDKLRANIDADDIVCLDSQLSTIYADQYEDGQVGAKLRMLATSAASKEFQLERPLEVPQFVTGVPAALLTHGELRKRRVRLFMSLHDVATTAVDVMQPFLSLTGDSSSVLYALERPKFFQPTGESTQVDSTMSILYT